MMKKNDILVVEISGKRPGDKSKRTTEKFKITYDHLIISNNSEGYISDWDIINVPSQYSEWYQENFKIDDNSYYAPMNRSYAIKYAKEHGYKYLVQLDDNILYLQIKYLYEKNGMKFRYSSKFIDNLDEYIDILCTCLEESNAGMAGCRMLYFPPTPPKLVEGYVYSLFALDLSVCPEIFQGGFEDDIEYRLKLKQLGIPSIQVTCLNYAKISQGQNKDLTGCREEYARAGIKRGEKMIILYNDMYKAKMSQYSHTTMKHADDDKIYFNHTLKSFKLGIIFRNKKAIEDKITKLILKYKNENLKFKTPKIKNKKIKK